MFKFNPLTSQLDLVGSGTTYTLPIASASVLGGIKVGTRLSIDAGTGVLSADVQGGAGDVVGPATNTADYIPQWNGANSKTLKDGLAVPAGGLAGLTALADKAPIASPTFTGTPAAPTATAGDSTTQIATTAFVQSAVRSVPSKEASNYATIAALPTVVYYNGVANDGVGATLTGFAVGALGVDSQSPVVGNRILVKNQADNKQNGIYTVTATGSGIAVFVMTRALDFNQQQDIKTGASTYVVGGTTLAATTWDVNSADNPVIGTDAITFIQSAGPGSIIAGTGISISGVTVAIDTSVTVDKTTAQTLTNKTLTSPNINEAVALTSTSTELNALHSQTGSWTTFTPTWTGFTIGNGTKTGAYIQIGKLVWFRAGFTFGSSGSAITGSIFLTLPVTIKSATYTSYCSIGVGAAFNGADTFPLEIAENGQVFYYNATKGNNISSGAPFTWANGHSMTIQGFYEAA